MPLEATRKLTQGTDNRVGGKSAPWFNIAVAIDLAEIKNADVIVGAARDHRVFIEGKNSPNTPDLALMHELGRDLPLFRLPDECLPIPAARHNVCRAGRYVECADIVPMPNEESVSVVGRGQGGPLRFNDGLLAAGDDKAVGPGFRGAEVCEGVDIAVALAGYGGIECRGLVAGLAPETDGLIAGRGEDRVRGREADGADLRDAALVSTCVPVQA